MNQGKTLHREFVGMLFALAIAEVAVRSGAVANSDVDLWSKAPALSHLLLAATVIGTSWVGWGQSKSSLSNIEHIFTWDFVELTIDVWLVGVYFFIVQGAEAMQGAAGTGAVQGSLHVEALWVMVMFWTYFVWDVLTKWKKPEGELIQRGWASLVCAVIASWEYFALGGLVGTKPVVLADLSLLFLVLVFRAMKRETFSDLTRSNWAWIMGLLVAWGLLSLAACAGSPQ